MRRLSVLVLLASLIGLAHASRAADAPDPPSLGMTRTDFERFVEFRHASVISEFGGIVALESSDPDIEFERYQFTEPTTLQPSRLWQIQLAYRMPTSRAGFIAVEKDLANRLGPPVETVSREAEHGALPYERRVWREANTSVTLVACPDGETVSDEARLQVVTVERQLEQIALAQRKKAVAQRK
ncbi:MAG: hypothetical protein ACHQ52_05410 [Candidatus Eisenbacteria bacterium]